MEIWKNKLGGFLCVCVWGGVMLCAFIICYNVTYHELCNILEHLGDLTNMTVDI